MNTLVESSNQENECNICYETGFSDTDIVVLNCCNGSKSMCVHCIHCLTTPICPYCRNPLQENCVPYLSEANNISRSDPQNYTIYSWEDFLEDENIINPYIYEDSRRLRRQIRRLRYEYQQRVSRTNVRQNNSQQRRSTNRERRANLNHYSRQARQFYNETHNEELIFSMD
jgi:hypothetical protein